MQIISTIIQPGKINVKNKRFKLNEKLLKNKSNNDRDSWL